MKGKYFWRLLGECFNELLHGEWKCARISLQGAVRIAKLKEGKQ